MFILKIKKALLIKGIELMRQSQILTELISLQPDGVNL